MRKKTYLYFLCSFLLFGTISAQDFDRYKRLRHEGEIPQELLTRSSEKFANEKEELSDVTNKKEQRNRENFLLQSNFEIDELLRSGKVLFNDPVGSYLNRIKDYLLREYPEYNKKVKVYAVRSPMVNAFCTNSGVVLVHMGLLSKVENEAQLAYILSHEFQHFIQQHPINRYVEGQKMKEQKGIFGITDYDSYMDARNRYSREQELEADMEGLELFLKSDYDVAQLVTVFDVMRYSYLPFSETPWTPAEFETGSLLFPEAFQMDSIQAISAEEDYDDTKMSHPNIAKRRLAVTDRMQAGADGGSQKFIFGEESFLNVQKICRFEIAQQYLAGHSYERAIYHSFLLQQSVPNSWYLRKKIAQSLYGLAKHKNAGMFYEVHRDFEDVEGESQQLYFFFEQMTKPELTALAINYNWRMYQEFSEEEVFKTMTRDLVQDFYLVSDEWVDDMRRDIDTSEDDSAPTVESPKDNDVWEETEGEEFDAFDTDEDSTDTESDYDWKHLKESALEEARGSDNYWLKNSLIDMFQDQEFEELWDEEGEDGETLEISWEDFVSEFDWKVNSEEPSQLGLDKVVFLNPIYKKIDQRSDNPVEYIASEKAQEEFLDLMADMGNRVKLETQILSNSSLTSADVADFNDQILIRAWISEQMSNETGPGFVNIYQEDVGYLFEKYGTSNFAMNGGIFYTGKRSISEKALLCYSCFMIVTLPISVAKLLSPKHGIMYFNWVWDVEAGEIKMRETRFIKMKENLSTLKSALYYSFLQMKTQP